MIVLDAEELSRQGIVCHTTSRLSYQGQIFRRVFSCSQRSYRLAVDACRQWQVNGNTCLLIALNDEVSVWQVIPEGNPAVIADRRLAWRLRLPKMPNPRWSTKLKISPKFKISPKLSLRLLAHAVSPPRKLEMDFSPLIDLGQMLTSSLEAEGDRPSISAHPDQLHRAQPPGERPADAELDDSRIASLTPQGLNPLRLRTQPPRPQLTQLFAGLPPELVDEVQSVPTKLLQHGPIQDELPTLQVQPVNSSGGQLQQQPASSDLEIDATPQRSPQRLIYRGTTYET